MHRAQRHKPAAPTLQEAQLAHEAFPLVRKNGTLHRARKSVVEYVVGDANFMSATDDSVISRYLAVEEPNGSVHPNQRIIKNNEDYFGPPPDVGLDARFGYTLPGRTNMRADRSGNPDTRSPFIWARIIDGEMKYAVPVTSPSW